MDKRNLWSRVLVIVGLAAMLIGAIDPLEGSLIILPGCVLVAIGALLVGSRHKKLILWALALVAVGVGAGWGWSAVGGFGGLEDGGRRSNWWALTIAPYPIGWVMGIVGAVMMLRGGRKAPAAPPDAR